MTIPTRRKFATLSPAERPECVGCGGCDPKTIGWERLSAAGWRDRHAEQGEMEAEGEGEATQ